MVYLTYSEYQELGGTLSNSDFTIAERKARRKLDLFTQDRLKALESISSDVKECMTEFIDKMQNGTSNGNITSYSNGIESFGFEKNQDIALDSKLFTIAMEYLPIEYVSLIVGEV